MLSLPEEFTLPKSLNCHGSNSTIMRKNSSFFVSRLIILSSFSMTLQVPMLRFHLFLIHLRNPFKMKRFRLFSTVFSLFYQFSEIFFVKFKSLTFQFTIWECA